MAKSERDEVLNLLASRIFSTMLDDIVMEAALQSHQEEARNRAICDVCHTRCGQAHVSGPSNPGLNAAVQNGLSGSRPGTPAGTGGTSTPSKDGNIFLECVNCGRPTASNRYAAHLSGCMNLGNGTRRGAARTASAKPKLGSEAGRSASPFLGSDNGNASDDSGRISQPIPRQPKPKGRPPKNKPRVPISVEETEPLSNKKRPGSPLASSPNKTKKQKISGPPLSRIKSGDIGGPNTNQLLGLPSAKSRSNIPSRLRESSTASFLEPDPSTSPDSRSSSPGTIPINAATPSSHGSETRKWNANANGNGRANGVGKAKKLPPRLPSPPRPPSPIIRRPETDYLVDVEGDETGSSTDTDSD